MAQSEERKWSVFNSQTDVGVVLNDLTPAEEGNHVPVLLTVPLGLRELKLSQLEDPLDELLAARKLGFFMAHTQKLDGSPPMLCLLLVRRDLMSPGLDAIRAYLAQHPEYGEVQVEVLQKFPGWADPRGQRLADQLSDLPKAKPSRPAGGCLGGMFGPRDVLLDVWFYEEWDFEGQQSPAFAAIEQRLIPAIESRLIGSHEGEGSFVDRVQYNVGFVIKKKFVATAVDVLSKELRAMGAPQSTEIEVSGQTYKVY